MQIRQVSGVMTRGTAVIVSELVTEEEFGNAKSLAGDKFFGKFFLVQKKLYLYVGVAELVYAMDFNLFST